MKVELHPHAKQRIAERGATKKEVVQTVKSGETFPAKFGRTGFRLNFQYDKAWRGKKYSTKQVEAYAVQEQNRWLVVTVIVKYF